MRINRTRFYTITLLIVLLPIWGNWKLFLFGHIATGRVIAYEKVVTVFNSSSIYPVIQFDTSDTTLKVRGPENVKYPLEKEIKVLYNSKAPNHYIIFNLQGLFLNPKTFMSGLLLLFWIAFYLSFLRDSENKISGKDKRGKIDRGNR